MKKKLDHIHYLERKVARLNGRLAHLHTISDQLARARLILFALAGVVSAAVFLTLGPVPWLWASLLALLPFVAAVALHRRVETAVNRFATWRDIQALHLAQMQLDWAELPSALPLAAAFSHPFALDLDLVGARSLHQLLDTAVSHNGSELLRDWLIDTDPALADISRRQVAVRELADWPLFRDKLTLHGRLAAPPDGERWAGDALLAWLQKQRDAAEIRPLLGLLAGLSLLTLGLLALKAVADVGNWWLLPWGLYVFLYALRGTRLIDTLFTDAMFLEGSLRTLHEVFGFLETTRYGKRPFAQQLCAPFLDAVQRPSQQMRRLRRVVAGIGLRQNPFVGLLINLIVPWDLFFAYRLRLVQATLGQRLPMWLDVWYELEALSSLATFADLNADLVTFPTVRAWQVGETAVLFEAVALGHPLIPDAQRVNNDFAFTRLGELGIITGSNMAGKSSFLRAIGLNVALAYAGGAVLASSLQTVLFRLYTSIRVADSLVDGYSFFYAEVRRLQQILAAFNAMGERPLFFLIDEIFRGTNNRERLIGSRSFIRALVGGQGVGLIATHDLELVKLADENDAIRNFHFRDDVQNGQMVFDYLLRPGPSPTTNALRIMALAGLPVEGTSEEVISDK